MDYNFFTYEGIEYVIINEDDKKVIYKNIDNKLVSLSKDELEHIEKMFDNKYSYTYKSERLNNIISSNPNIESKEYIANFLNWLEGNIPESEKEKFYKKVSTLKTKLNYNAELKKDIEIREGFYQSAGYNTNNNTITIDEKSVLEMKKISLKTSDPGTFFWTHYSQQLLHELAHMASSNYDKETGVSLCGFDRYPAEKEEDKNRGLTEGFTELVSMSGVPGTYELSSGYYIEASLINQMIQIIGIDIFKECYFCNLGITPLKEKFNEIIKSPLMTTNLFRLIELNFNLGHINEKQNILVNIEQILLKYYDRKLELLKKENRLDEIAKSLIIYENMLITPEKLKIMNKKPDNYVGINECIEQFNEIKNKYSSLINQNINKSIAAI